MAKKPIRVYKKTKGRMVPIDPAKVSSTAPRGVQVYKDGDDVDRLSITQRVVEHTQASRAHLDRGPSEYDALFHSIYDAVFLTDLEGNISSANARAEYAFMLPSDELCQANIVDLISGADERLLELIMDNVDNKRFTVLEAVCQRADQSRFFSEIVVNKLRGGGDKTLCIFIRDETERKQAEEELKEAHEQLVDAEKVRARLDTLSTLFYAMNNPLQILMCMAELDENKEYKKQVSRIIGVMNRLRDETTLEVITDDGGSTRYDIKEQRDLEAPDISKVLIVDDERILRDMFLKSLSTVFSDLTIDTAADGREARDMFAENHYGLVVMDLSMPVMNGEEAFEEIRQICEAKSLALPPFIFCTGFVISENLQEIIGDQSYHRCLTKPLEIAELIRLIQDILHPGSQTA